MDETSICLFQGHGKGNVLLRKSAKCIQNVSSSVRKTRFTFVAFICDDEVVQPALPQFLIVNTRTLTVAQHVELQASLPPRVRILRSKSAWLTSTLCCRMVRCLAADIAPFAIEKQPILFMDALKQHFADTVLQTCAALGIWPICVPAQMTWLLQPLDTHCFGSFKAFLQKACQTRRCGNASGRITSSDVVECVCETVANVVDARPWARAFADNGFATAQQQVGRRILAELKCEHCPVVSNERPSVHQLKSCFPRRAKVSHRRLWKPIDKYLERLLGDAADAEFADDEAEVADDLDEGAHIETVAEPICFRTRAGLRRLAMRPFCHIQP